MKSIFRKLMRKSVILTMAFVLFGAALFQKVLYLSAEPDESKDCDPLDVSTKADSKVVSVLEEDMSLVWSQKGGTINDASCLDETVVYGIVQVQKLEDIKKALQYARARKLPVSIAGVKHSMGGQAFSKNAIVLDMTKFNNLIVNEEKSTMTVESGATWHDIQSKIHPKYAIKAMQSTDIFTVGGSISVNAHGMDHSAGAIENSILSMRVLLPNGEIRRVSRTENYELYNLVIGGYGLFAIILDTEIELVPNDLYQSSRKIMSYKDFPEVFKNEIAPNDDVGLMYAHLSTAPGKSFLDETLVYIYEKDSGPQVSPEDIPPLGEVSSTKLRRLVINFSKYGGFAQTLKWWMEKYIEPKLESCTLSRNQAQTSGEACLVSRNEPMHDSVKYLKNDLKKEADILHEYFIPRANIVAFIDDLREIMIQNDVNLLNASIRVVNKERGLLTYAPREAFSVVLYINQKTTSEGNESMKKVTQKLIDASVKQGGRFFLPYQLHYTSDQLKASYPEIDTFFALKKKYDPEELLTNTFYKKYAQKGF